MNSGFRDAGNLAWKLAMVVRGQADPAILDTYEVERAPHVRQIITAAIRYGRMTCTVDAALAAERDRRWREDRRPVTERMPFSLPPLEPGPLVLDGGGELFIQPGRLDDVVGQRFLVLGRDESAFGGSREWWTNVAGALVATPGELPDPDAELTRWMERRSATSVVVRPDRYVLAAGRDLDAVTRRVARILRAPGRALTPSPVTD
jgi:3-(3-hydroxy-phenyl)propionate hydroxylase